MVQGRGLFLNAPLIVAVDSRNPSPLLAGTDLGLLGSRNGGLTWAPEARERDGFVYPMAGPGLGTRLQPECLMTAADCQRRVTKA